MMLLWDYFVLSFSALLPLINPLGSALIFLSLVGPAPILIYRSLARRIAFNTVLFLIAVDLIGSALLRFFGISLPIVQISGGLVIATIAWSMLNQESTDPSQEKMQAAAQVHPGDVAEDLRQKIFYPFTFPITAGPGCIVVMLSLAAHTPQRPIKDNLLAHARPAPRDPDPVSLRVSVLRVRAAHREPHLALHRPRNPARHRVHPPLHRCSDRVERTCPAPRQRHPPGLGEIDNDGWNEL